MDEARIREQIEQSKEASRQHTPSTLRDYRNQGQRLALERKLERAQRIDAEPGKIAMLFAWLIVLSPIILFGFLVIASN